MPKHDLLRVGLTFVAGLAGGYLFFVLGLPAPWLSGAMVGIAAGLAVGLRPAMPDPLRDVGLLFAGVVMGSAITPEMLQALQRYPGSLAILAITTIAVSIAGQTILVRFWNWKPDAALFASLPGAMSAVLSTAAELRIDMARVATLQSFRMFILVALLPSVVVLSVSTHPSVPVAPLTNIGFAIVMFAGLAVALVFERLRVLSPFMLGGMAAAGALHATALVPGAPPALVVDASMLLIGVFVGTRFGTLTLRDLIALLVPGMVLFFVTTFVALIGALATWKLVGTNLPEALVAFAPGGLEAMVILGLALGLDPLYVAGHHVARFLMIALGLPFIARWILSKRA